jgi:cell division protein FtsB
VIIENQIQDGKDKELKALAERKRNDYYMLEKKVKGFHARLPMGRN